MKNKLLILSLVLMCSFFFISCDKKEDVIDDDAPSRIEIQNEVKEVEVSDRVIYVSPTGAGMDGTKENPTSFVNATIIAKPGNTILLMEGKYTFGSRINLTTDGLYNARITIKPEVEGTKVVLDFSRQAFNSTNRGIQLYGDYYTIYGIDVCGAGDNGLYVCGNYNIIENCQFYNNRDSGLQLGRGYSEQTTIDEWPSNNLIKNCTSFNNYDDETLGENADGFAAKLTVGYGNVFDGCIAYRNSDDGWDLYGKEDSGNIGNVILYNCVSFENGYVATPLTEENADGTTYTTYNTPNGDGIGFKLGGSAMEGDVIISNCVAFNNKLHGFSDNSNPGMIQMKNCTAFNNCIGLNDDGTVNSVRGIKQEENKSNNFDMARTTNSYNSYYGLLSYINNQVGYSGDYNTDMFRGVTAYSIFQTEYDKDNSKEIYLAVGDYMDASSYSNDALKMPELRYELTDACFADLSPVNALEDKMFTIHSLFRNEDLSVNLGDLLRVVDDKLLTFVEGNPIGAVLNKTSIDQYEHPDYANISSNLEASKVLIKHCYDVVDVLTNKDAVYQDFELPVYLNNCEIKWSSNNENVISIENKEKISLSAASYIFARVNTPQEETKVTLTATIILDDQTMEKTFEINVMPRESRLGSLISNKTDVTFIVGRYQAFNQPVITVTDGSSVTSTKLNKDLYDFEVIYDYALERGGSYTRVDGIYTSVPGVFRVTTKAVSKIPSEVGKTMSYEYFVFIGDDDCEIDFNGGIHDFTVNAEGFNITATLSNITGRIYAVVTDHNSVLFNAEDVINHPDVQVRLISTDDLNVNFDADNSSVNGYRVFYVISDKTKNHTSKVYSKSITTQSISTHQEFYDLARGITTSSETVIYHLTKDLDFTDYVWADTAEPKEFVGTFNGNGHTISNLTINSNIQKQVSVFYKLVGGTIINTNFTNISITNTHKEAQHVGIVGVMNGGYISNIDLTNVSINATEEGSYSVGALVGQIINGDCYIDHVQLINDENQIIRCGKKYMGGIVGNIQLESSMVAAKVYISYCLVKADIGDGLDSGGCHGGIVGRIKNDNATGEYYLDINNCYYKGTIITNGNYNAGILGSVESGNWPYAVNNNFSDVVFIYKGIRLDATAFNALEEEIEQEYAHKNSNPIIGRGTSLFDRRLGDRNAGSWKEYYKDVINSTSIYFMNGPDFVPDGTYFESACGWDLSKWNITENGEVTLK